MRGTPMSSELVALRSSQGCTIAPIEDVFQRYPHVLELVVAYADRPFDFYRHMRLWSRTFTRFCQEEPVAVGLLVSFNQRVARFRALLYSDKKRSVRLLVCLAWIISFGIICPVLSICAVLEDPKSSDAQIYAYRIELLVVTSISLILVLLMPSAESALVPGLQEAVEQSRSVLYEPGFLSAYTQDSLLTDFQAAQSSIGASQKFVASIKLSLALCSSLGLFVIALPLLGSCVACVALLGVACCHARFVGYDVKLSVLSMYQPPRARSQGRWLEQDMDLGSTFLMEQWAEDERLQAERLSHLPENSRLLAVCTLTSICLFMCGFRSLVVWVSTLRACADAESDIHDVACFPSLVAMICPGFLAVGSMLRFGMTYRGCCSHVGYPRSGCYLATGVYLVLPLVILNVAGAFLVFKLLADIARTPVAEVFFLWRIPTWEELLVFFCIASLWIALLVFSMVVSACVRILRNSDEAVCVGFFSVAYLLGETCLNLLVFMEGRNFLPELLVITSSMSTIVLALLFSCRVLYTILSFVGSSPQERPAIGYGYLWG